MSIPKLWYSVQVELGMSRPEFLRSSAAEIDGLLERVAFRDKRQRFMPAALIASTIANSNLGPDSDPIPLEYFLLGGDGPKTKEDEMIEWVESLESGEYEEDPEAVERFKQKMKATFRMGG